MADQRAKLEREWMREGAEARLKQIREEMDVIFQTFPELRGRSAPASKAPVTGKRVFSPTGKRAISEGMRKYWARRKAREAKASKSA